MDEKNPDGLKYPLTQIYFYLVDSCNLKCRHCWISPKYQSADRPEVYLPADLFRSIIDQAVPLGLMSVKLTGGEPLLHPGIGEIVDTVKAKGLMLGIETNGTLMTPGLAKAISRCKDPFVSVSLDGLREAHEWMRGVEGCFDGAVKGIRALVDAGVRSQIIMTISRRNCRQIGDVLKLAESLKCGSVKFNVMQPTSRGKGLHDMGEALTIEELIGLGEWVEGELSSRARLRVFFDHPMAFRPLGKLFGGGRDGCASCNILHLIGVLADGTYTMCGIGKHMPELIYGRAPADRLADVWRDSPVINEIREGLPERMDGVCRECVMKEICLGSCIAQNYYTNKSLWAPYWYCEEARKMRLFPESRLFVSKSGGRYGHDIKNLP